MANSEYHLDIWFVQDNVNVLFDQLLAPYTQYTDPYLPKTTTSPTAAFCCLSGTGGTIDNLGYYIGEAVGRVVQWHYDTDGTTKVFERIVEGKIKYGLSNGYVRYFDNLFTNKDKMFFGWLGNSYNLSYKYIIFDTTKVEYYGENTYGTTTMAIGDTSLKPATEVQFTDFTYVA